MGKRVIYEERFSFGRRRPVRGLKSTTWKVFKGGNGYRGDGGGKRTASLGRHVVEFKIKRIQRILAWGVPKKEINYEESWGMAQRKKGKIGEERKTREESGESLKKKIYHRKVGG